MGEYTFENCLDWLAGSRPMGALNSQWREIFDMDRLSFLYPETFVSIQNERRSGSMFLQMSTVWEGNS